MLTEMACFSPLSSTAALPAMAPPCSQTLTCCTMPSAAARTVRHSSAAPASVSAAEDGSVPLRFTASPACPAAETAACVYPSREISAADTAAAWASPFMRNRACPFRTLSPART